MMAPLLLLATLLSAFAQEIPQAPSTPLEEGRTLLGEKKVDAAIAALRRCLAEAGPKGAMATDCHWELGWAFWTKGSWAEVASHWEKVKAQDPGRKGLDEYLAQARDNLALEALLVKGRNAAPKTFRSNVPAGTTLRLRAVGDMMIGTTFPEGALNPEVDSTFADVADWLKGADLTFGNLEGPLCDSGVTDKCKPEAPEGSCYAFRSPTIYKHLYQQVGFDVMSTANNHAADFGPECRVETEKQLETVGIAHSGRPGDIASLQAKGLKIAVIGFHTNRNSHYVNDHEAARDIVKAMDQDHDLVIVSFHGGAEGSKALHVPQGEETFYGENRGDLRTFSRVVIDAGADLVIGHGPHVLRGMEVYRNRLIAYSLGNFATYGRFNISGNAGIGAVLEVELAPDGRFVGGKVLPTRQVNGGVPIKDAEGKAVDLIRALSETDFPGSAVQVAQDGTLRAP